MEDDAHTHAVHGHGKGDLGHDFMKVICHDKRQSSRQASHVKNKFQSQVPVDIWSCLGIHP